MGGRKDGLKKMANSQWVLDDGKYLRKGEVERLMSAVEKRKQEAETKSKKVPIRDHFVINLAMLTGLRVQELADLNCGDFCIGDEGSFLIVKNGKGSKRRTVRFNGKLRKAFLKYIDWKKKVGEATGAEDPLILSSNTKSHMTTRALQKVFKRCAKRAGIGENYSIHSLRHTYACYLYKASEYDLRLVQKQLGHSSTKVTEVYADVLNPDADRALARLYVGNKKLVAYACGVG